MAISGVQQELTGGASGYLGSGQLNASTTNWPVNGGRTLPASYEVAVAPAAAVLAVPAAEAVGILVVGLGAWAWYAVNRDPAGQADAVQQMSDDLAAVWGWTKDQAGELYGYLTQEVPKMMQAAGKDIGNFAALGSALYKKTLQWAAGAFERDAPTAPMTTQEPSTQRLPAHNTATVAPPLDRTTGGSEVPTALALPATTTINQPAAPDGVQQRWGWLITPQLSQMLPTQAVQRSLRELGVTIDKPAAKLNSVAALTSQYEKLQSLKMVLGGDGWSQLSSAGGLGAEMTAIQGQLQKVMTQSANRAKALMTEGETLLHSGRAPTAAERQRLTAIDADLGRLQQRLEAVYWPLKLAGLYEGFSHPVAQQVGQWRSNFDSKLAATAATRANQPVSDASRSGGSLQTQMQQAQSQVAGWGQALQQLQSLPANATVTERQQALAQVQQAGGSLQRALAQPEVTALLGRAVSAAQGGPPLPPPDDKLLTALLNGLSNALASSVGDVVQGALTGQPVDPQRQAQGAMLALAVGMAVPNAADSLVYNATSNAVSGGLETWLRQAAGVDPTDPNAVLANALLGAGLGVVADGIFKALSRAIGGPPAAQVAGGGPGPRVGNNELDPKVVPEQPLPSVGNDGGAPPADGGPLPQWAQAEVGGKSVADHLREYLSWSKNPTAYRGNPPSVGAGLKQGGPVNRAPIDEAKMQRALGGDITAQTDVLASLGLLGRGAPAAGPSPAGPMVVQPQLQQQPQQGTEPLRGGSGSSDGQAPAASSALDPADRQAIAQLFNGDVASLPKKDFVALYLNVYNGTPTGAPNPALGARLFEVWNPAEAQQLRRIGDDHETPFEALVALRIAGLDEPRIEQLAQTGLVANNVMRATERASGSDALTTNFAYTVHNVVAATGGEGAYERISSAVRTSLNAPDESGISIASFGGRFGAPQVVLEEAAMALRARVRAYGNLTAEQIIERANLRDNEIVVKVNPEQGVAFEIGTARPVEVVPSGGGNLSAQQYQERLNDFASALRRGNVTYRDLSVEQIIEQAHLRDKTLFITRAADDPNNIATMSATSTHYGEIQALTGESFPAGDYLYLGQLTAGSLPGSGREKISALQAVVRDSQQGGEGTSGLEGIALYTGNPTNINTYIDAGFHLTAVRVDESSGKYVYYFRWHPDRSEGVPGRRYWVGSEHGGNEPPPVLDVVPAQRPGSQPSSADVSPPPSGNTLESAAPLPRQGEPATPQTILPPSAQQAGRDSPLPNVPLQQPQPPILDVNFAAPGFLADAPTGSAFAFPTQPRDELRFTIGTQLFQPHDPAAAATTLDKFVLGTAAAWSRFRPIEGTFKAVGETLQGWTRPLTEWVVDIPSNVWDALPQRVQAQLVEIATRQPATTLPASAFERLPDAPRAALRNAVVVPDEAWNSLPADVQSHLLRAAEGNVYAVQTDLRQGAMLRQAPFELPLGVGRGLEWTFMGREGKESLVTRVAQGVDLLWKSPPVEMALGTSKAIGFVMHKGVAALMVLEATVGSPKIHLYNPTGNAPITDAALEALTIGYVPKTNGTVAVTIEASLVPDTSITFWASGPVMRESIPRIDRKVDGDNMAARIITTYQANLAALGVITKVGGPELHWAQAVTLRPLGELGANPTVLQASKTVEFVPGELPGTLVRKVEGNLDGYGLGVVDPAGFFGIYNTVRVGPFAATPARDIHGIGSGYKFLAGTSGLQLEKTPYMEKIPPGAVFQTNPAHGWILPTQPPQSAELTADGLRATWSVDDEGKPVTSAFVPTRGAFAVEDALYVDPKTGWMAIAPEAAGAAPLWLDMNTANAAKLAGQARNGAFDAPAFRQGWRSATADQWVQALQTPEGRDLVVDRIATLGRSTPASTVDVDGGFAAFVREIQDPVARKIVESNPAYFKSMVQQWLGPQSR